MSSPDHRIIVEHTITLAVSGLSLRKLGRLTPVTTINLIFPPNSNLSYQSIQSAICAKLNSGQSEQNNETTETVEEIGRKTTKTTRSFRGFRSEKIYKSVGLRWKDTEGTLVRLDDQEDLREALSEMVVDKKAAAGEGRLEVVVSMPDGKMDAGDRFEALGETCIERRMRPCRR